MYRFAVRLYRIVSKTQDNLFLKRGQLARNVDLVEKVVRIAEELDSEIATSAEMRALLGLKGKEDVTFPKVEETVA